MSIPITCLAPCLAISIEPTPVPQPKSRTVLSQVVPPFAANDPFDLGHVGKPGLRALSKALPVPGLKPSEKTIPYFAADFHDILNQMGQWARGTRTDSLAPVSQLALRKGRNPVAANDLRHVSPIP